MKYSKDNLTNYMLKEIEIVQDIIKRMANNSFIIKGWCITLVVGTFLINGKNIFILVAFIPLLFFWVLDAYFLHLENLYIELYKWIITNRLNTAEYLFDMNYKRFEKVSTLKDIIKKMFSTSLSLFYGSLILITIVILTIILTKGCL